MRRAFRFDPPSLPAGAMTRPRLVRILQGRWARRVTAVVGGPGLGKTTLLVQALHENRLAPRGRDVWLHVEPADGDGLRLVEDVLTALGAPTSGDPIDAVGAAVWSHAPEPVCLVFDDVHHLDSDADAVIALDRLIEELPANGHVVIASRASPPLRLARLFATDQVAVIEEGDLRLNAAEAAEFEAMAGLAHGVIAETGGWPALAQLAMRTGASAAGAYLWEEVLRPLRPADREAFAAVCDLRRANDALAAAALDRPVDLAAAIGTIPLVARSQDGWFEPHALWQGADAVALEHVDRVALRTRAVAHLADDGRFDEAFDLLAGAEIWELAPDLFRRACRVGARPVVDTLSRWLRLAPAAVGGSAGGLLARGVLFEMAEPAKAKEPLSEAARLFRESGDVDGEAAAVTHLGRLAWWEQDYAALVELVPRVSELAASGVRVAAVMDQIGKALIADLTADDGAVAAALEGTELGSGDAWWDGVTAWFRSLVVPSGEPSEALAILDIAPVDDPVIELVLEAARGGQRWASGDLGWLRERSRDVLSKVEANGVAQNFVLGCAWTSGQHSHLGEVEEAEALLDRARPHRDNARGNAIAALELAECALLLARGDEEAAAERLRGVLTLFPLERGSPRRSLRLALATTYVLLPETRPLWDALAAPGHLGRVRDLARAVAAGRGAEVTDTIARVDLTDIGAIRTALPYGFVAELVARAHETRTTEAVALLDAAGPPARAAMRRLTSQPGPLAADARRVLGATPSPPDAVVSINVLGPFEVLRAGIAVQSSELRRERVRGLVGLLLSQDRLSRDAIFAALWPDLDEKAAANNLRVTIAHLNRALEPDRPENEPPYFVRSEGGHVRLVTAGLDVDLHRFESSLRAASRAEEDGTPSLALDSYRAALACYRGNLLADLPEAEWFALDRDRLRMRYVEAAIRTAQLLAASGDVDGADECATAALRADPWSEAAAAAMAATALDRGNVSAAREHLKRCATIAEELGVDPSEETRRLQRRLRATR